MPQSRQQLHQKIWVVIPAYNEQNALTPVLDALLAAHFNVVVVDDGSSDQTFQTAKQRPVHVLRHIINFGQGAALETGKQYAVACGAEYICTFDADGQHRVEDISTLLEYLEDAQADIAIGSRFLGAATDMPTSRRLLLKLGIIFHRVFYGINLTDTHNGLRLMTQDAAKKIEISSPGMAHATEILAAIHDQNLNYVEVPVTINYTEYSLNKGQNIFSFINTLKELLIGSLYK